MSCPRFRIKLREETDRQQLKADICISNSELLSLEKKCEAVISNSTQLDSQKLEAQKRLDDIDEKVSPIAPSAQTSLV